MDYLFGSQLDILAKSLDASVLRQQVLANNIANANTPGFSPQAVAFEDQLKQALAAQDGFQQVALDLEDVDPKLFPELYNYNLANIQPVVYQSGEKLDIHKQMVELSKNQIWYQTLISQGVSKMFSRLNFVLGAIQ